MGQRLQINRWLCDVGPNTHLKSTINVHTVKWNIRDYDETVAMLNSNARMMRLPAMASYARARGYHTCITSIYTVNLLKKLYGGQ